VPKDTERTPQHRPTLADQNARYYELLMAMATKPARTGTQTTEFGERTTGVTNGHLYFKSVQLVQRDDESDVAFVGRQEEYLRTMISLRDLLNAEHDARVVGAANGEAE
jgi:hypothetical protein